MEILRSTGLVRQFCSRITGGVVLPSGQIDPDMERYQPDLSVAMLRLVLLMFAAGNDENAISFHLSAFNHSGRTQIFLYLPDTGIAFRSRGVFLPLHRLAECYYFVEGATRLSITNTVKHLFGDAAALLPVDDERHVLPRAQLDRVLDRLDVTGSALVARAVHWCKVLERQPIEPPRSSNPHASRALLTDYYRTQGIREEQVSVRYGWVLQQYLMLCHDLDSLSLSRESLRVLTGALTHVCGQTRLVRVLHAIESCPTRIVSPLRLTDLF